MVTGIDYSSEEWRESTAHNPLSKLPVEDFLLVHRHYMWANQQRIAFDNLLKNPSREVLEPGPLMMATREMGFMFVWYGLLWSVIEGFAARRIDLRGPFRDDVDRLSNTLRRCRNAVLHVPEEGQLLDSRIEALVSEADSATILRRIHRGVGRLFIEEHKRRQLAEPET